METARAGMVSTRVRDTARMAGVTTSWNSQAASELVGGSTSLPGLCSYVEIKTVRRHQRKNSPDYQDALLEHDTSWVCASRTGARDA